MDIYLDHNATSIIDDDALSALISAHKECFGNPSSTHALGRKAKAKYLNAKDTIANFFNVTSQQVFFTRSATEAINWLLFHKNYKHIISTDLEHAATYNCLKELEKRGTKVTFISPGLKGHINKEDLEKAITEQTDLIILSSANSETGIIQNTHEISRLSKSKGIPFYVDAVGLLGKGIFEVDQNVTAYVISSHKIHGPKGVAALIHKHPEELSPWLLGGYQENSKLAGTECLPQIIGFAHAFKKLVQDQSQIHDDLKLKQESFESALKKHLEITVIGENEPRVANTSCICFKGISGETLLQLLDHNHIYASHGSACSSGALEPSRVLVNMGLKYSEAKQCLRFSFSKFTTKDDIQKALISVIEIASAMVASV